MQVLHWTNSKGCLMKHLKNFGIVRYSSSISWSFQFLLKSLTSAFFWEGILPRHKFTVGKKKNTTQNNNNNKPTPQENKPNQTIPNSTTLLTVIHSKHFWGNISLGTTEILQIFLYISHQLDVLAFSLQSSERRHVQERIPSNSHHCSGWSPRTATGTSIEEIKQT